MEEIIFRCSSLGKLMTESRTKTDKLSETAKTYIQELFKEKELGIYKDISSRYLDKGIQMEDQAIQFAADVLGWEFVVKNTERFTNEFITGEPDINTDTLLADIKCSWSGSTFPMFDKELKNKDYFFQLQGYMWLTGHDKAELVYCLMNTPESLIEKEIYAEHYKAYDFWNGEENESISTIVRLNHNFDRIPNELRVKRFIIEKDEKSFERIREKVNLAREYYKQLKEQL